MNKTLDEFSCYKTYQALRLHFNGKMDFFKFGPDGGKIKARAKTYTTRKDRFYYQKLARKYKNKEFINLVVANFLKEVTWVGDVASESGEMALTDWQRKIQSISYIFERECSAVVDFLDEHSMDFTDLFVMGKSGFSPIIDLYYRQVLSLESLIIINNCIKLKKSDGSLCRFAELIKPQLLLAPLNTDNLYNVMNYYEPFLDYDKDKMRKIIVRKFK